MLLKEHTDERGGHESAFFWVLVSEVASEEYKSRTNPGSQIL